tara:strand:- start:752 stop:1483 length:732 start_codon:yes stop_codon:yes gene_type:complete
MSKVVTTTILPDVAGGSLTLGGTGDSVVVTGNDLRANTIQDTGGNTIFSSDGSGILSSKDSKFGGAMTLITENVLSNSTAVEFISGIDSTYDLYIFKWMNINPMDDGNGIKLYGSIDAGTNWNATKQTTMFKTYSYESGGSTGLTYDGGDDLANSANGQYLTINIGYHANELGCGELFLFAPSNTTYYKHFYSKSLQIDYGRASISNYVSGYFTTTSAITGMKFDINSTTANGIMKMYGLKKS